jgi:phytoene dehydrogenase-like protein
MQEPVEEHLSRFTSHRPLIDIIAQHFFRRTPAFFAMSYFSLYLDYRYPLGGTGALARAVADYCAGAGVEFLLSTSARAVDPTAHSLVDSSGREHRYRSLIWAADLKTLYRSVDAETLPKGGWGRRTRERRAFLEPLPGGDSVFTLYLATSRAPAYFAAISNGHLFYCPSREGVGASLLPDLDALLAGADALTNERLKPAVLAWLDRYLSKTTYEISIPVLKDPALAPPGKTGLIVSVLFDFRLTELAEARGWYEELKREVEDRMIASLSTSVYPGLDASILHRFSFSPSSLARYTGGADGAITGWAFGEGPRPAPHKMQEVGRSIITTMPEIFQAGQWTYSPAGLPISILTGKLAADAAVKLVSRRRAK